MRCAESLGRAHVKHQPLKSRIEGEPGSQPLGLADKILGEGGWNGDVSFGCVLNIQPLKSRIEGEPKRPPFHDRAGRNTGGRRSAGALRPELSPSQTEGKLNA